MVLFDLNRRRHMVYIQMKDKKDEGFFNNDRISVLLNYC